MTSAVTTAAGGASSRLRDDWPHTRRVMPWLLAFFLVMVFLVPFDGAELKIHLPVDSKLDRVVIGLMVVTMMFRRLVLGRTNETPRKRTAVAGAVLIFTSIAVLSVLINVDRIYRLGELTLAEKQLAELLGFVTFFFLVATIVRVSELRAWARLVLFLACLTAVGTLYESRTGFNPFYIWSAKLLSPIAKVMASPTEIHPINGRKTVVGPTEHGLALASMLTIALPFAILQLLAVKDRARRLLYIVAIGLILGASLATARKTAIIAPVAAVGVLVAYNRRLLKWVPVALVLVVPVIHVVAPGALGTFGILASSGSSNSTVGREDDYSAVTPDVLTHPLFGRGFGTLDPQNLRWYRILDNQYLGEIFQVGALGLLAYLAIVLSAIGTAHGVIKRGGLRAPPVLAASAGCAAYAVVSFTFDALSFPQAPYMFFFAAGLIAAAASQRDEEQDVPAALGFEDLASADRMVTSHAGSRSLAGVAP
jgi:O-antigen ligase